MFDVTQNPFVYGEVVPAAAFVDRVAELDRLVADLAAGAEGLPDLAAPLRQVVADPPRAGGDVAPRRATVEVTVSSFSSYVAFLEGYARALVAAETKWDRARNVAARGDPIGARRGPLRAGPVAARRPRRVSFPSVRSDRDISRLAQEVFALPARLAETRGRKVVVALDEFQAIAGFNGGSVEHAMRAAVQHQREVGYVFAGSEPSLMERMLGPKRPFYKAGPVMRLEKIPADEFAAFIDARFARSGMRPGAGARRRDRRARRQPALRRAAAGARNLGRGPRTRPRAARRSTICIRR